MLILDEEVDSVNGRIPAGLDIQVDTFTATNQVLIFILLCV